MLPEKKCHCWEYSFRVPLCVKQLWTYFPTKQHFYCQVVEIKGGTHNDYFGMVEQAVAKHKLIFTVREDSEWWFEHVSDLLWTFLYYQFLEYDCVRSFIITTCPNNNYIFMEYHPQYVLSPTDQINYLQNDQLSSSIIDIAADWLTNR